MFIETILDSYNPRCAVQKYSVFSSSRTEFFFSAEGGFVQKEIFVSKLVGLILRLKNDGRYMLTRRRRE